MKAYRIAAALLLCLSLTTITKAAHGPLSGIEGQLEATLTSGTAMSAEASASISNALAAALASDHRGLETAALRLVISYGEVLELNRSAVFEMVRLYRDNEDLSVRQMAVVAIGASEDEWGLDFLERSRGFEDAPRVLHTIRAVLADA